MAQLLITFSKEKNPFAPKIYKALTFFMIENHLDEEIRVEMNNLFISVFKEIPNIPIQILCEPLLKQLQINLEKADISGSVRLHQPNVENFFLSTKDIEFFLHIAEHPKLSESVAIQLIQIALEISRKNIIFTRACLKLLTTVLSKF